ncbi:MAG: exodeoxyribonuclease VII large subunit [Planctomycetota bacterium]|nr:exodeoxyribonuclease VII large subunit [Planctomycetota bacterium]
MGTRPLFDPERMKGPPPAAPPPPPTGSPPATAGDNHLTVSALALLVCSALEKLPQRIRVAGEISNFSDRTHWYFRLKDEQSIIDCVMFQTAARRAAFTPVGGDRVVLTGRVEFYPRQGRTQFYADAIERLGEGNLERRFKELCAELKALGWFDTARKRPLPAFPRRVAVVTSRTGAALQDVLVTMQQRCPAVDVLIADVRVQGDGAAQQIAATIDHLSASHRTLDIQAIIVTRGGGSLEDLWAFNERDVARAILQCAVPVVAAIGHEVDVTIAELVADERGATPTQAAMRLTPDRAALAEELAAARQRLHRAVLRRCEQRRERLAASARALAHETRLFLGRATLNLERCAALLARRRPEAVYAQRRAALAAASVRLVRAAAARLHTAELARAAEDLVRATDDALARRRERLNALARELLIAGPDSVLARGYSITLDAAGRAIRSASAVQPGDPLTTRLADGALRSTVTAEDAGPRQPPAQKPDLPPRPAASDSPRRRTSRRTADKDPGQMDLFKP